MNIAIYRKILLEAHALIEAHPPVWMPKLEISQKIDPNKGPPTNIEKNIDPTLCRKSQICYL